jgi:hypothetical protein
MHPQIEELRQLSIPQTARLLELAHNEFYSLMSEV